MCRRASSWGTAVNRGCLIDKVEQSGRKTTEGGMGSWRGVTSSQRPSSPFNDTGVLVLEVIVVNSSGQEESGRENKDRFSFMEEVVRTIE